MNGVSKAYCMTGWRIGYAGGPAPLIKAIAKVQSQSTSNPSSISQAAAVEALNGPQDFIAKHNVSFKERRDMVVEMLNQGRASIATSRKVRSTFILPAPAPSARRRLWARRLAPTTISSTYLLEAEGVAAVQGSAFGLSPHFRISYATSDRGAEGSLHADHPGLQGAKIGLRSAGVRRKTTNLWGIAAARACARAATRLLSPKSHIQLS